MNKLEVALGEVEISKRITALKEKNYSIPSWDEISKDYYPWNHKIATDKIGRRDKERKNEAGTVIATDIASRIYIGLEQLHTKRISEFMFALPVKRVYHNTEENKKRAEIANIMELVYKHSRIDNENLKRAEAYFASCELFTLWYTVKKRNSLYGFDSEYKLKCKTFSPIDGYELYPLMDEYGDMLAMSVEYQIKVNDSDVTYFETYTADKRYVYKMNTKSQWEEDKTEDIEILKIPGIYACRKEPIFHGLSHIREEIEYTVSRHSDVVAYNSAPVLKLVGEVAGQEEKGESQRIIRVENGGDVGYVSWSQSIEALKYHVETLCNLYWMQAQMPDISFANMKSLGNIGFDARMTLLTDAYLKCGEETGMWIEFFERETNVIKAFISKMRTDLKDEIDNVEVEHIITYYVQNDENAVVDRLMKSNGGKPIISHLDSIKMGGYTSDAQRTLDEINKEEADANAARMNSVFNEGGY